MVSESTLVSLAQRHLRRVLSYIIHCFLCRSVRSTALKILAGKMKPNLGRFDNPPDWQEILVYFRGSELQNYFTKILEDTMKATIKPQYVDHIPKAVRGKVGEILKAKDEVSSVNCVAVLKSTIQYH